MFNKHLSTMAIQNNPIQQDLSNEELNTVQFDSGISEIAKGKNIFERIGERLPNPLSIFEAIEKFFEGLNNGSRNANEAYDQLRDLVNKVKTDIDNLRGPYRNFTSGSRELLKQGFEELINAAAEHTQNRSNWNNSNSVAERERNRELVERSGGRIARAYQDIRDTLGMQIRNNPEVRKYPNDVRSIQDDMQVYHDLAQSYWTYPTQRLRPEEINIQADANDSTEIELEASDIGRIPSVQNYVRSSLGAGMSIADVAEGLREETGLPMSDTTAATVVLEIQQAQLSQVHALGE